MHLFSSPILRWDKPFIRKLLVVCLPIVIQNLLSASLNIIDGVMIGQLGDAPYAAVAQATRYVFVFQLFLFGAGSGCSIFFSQHWGTKDVPAMRRVMGLCFWRRCSAALRWRPRRRRWASSCHAARALIMPCNI